MKRDFSITPVTLNLLKITLDVENILPGIVFTN